MTYNGKKSLITETDYFPFIMYM